MVALVQFSRCFVIGQKIALKVTGEIAGSEFNAKFYGCAKVCAQKCISAVEHG
jgi:hypothetical protein